MKKISVLIALGMLMIAPWGMAQTIYDGAKLTGKDLNGTARFVGMGGAMGALGGDISTMGTNPAGIGLYRSSDVMTSFGFSLYGNESQYLGKKFNSDLTKGDFNNIGFVFSSKIGNETPLRFVNFGFNYHKAKSFNNNMRMQGRRIIFFTIFSFVISLLYCWLLTYYHLLMSIIFLIFIRYIKT